MEQAETIDSLRVHVRRCLDKFNQGLFFTEYGLSETVQLIPDGVDPENLEAVGLMEKKCAFQIFLKAVASEIVKEKGVTKGRKKRSKDYLEILQAFSSEWVEYIRKNMRKKQQAKMNKLSVLGIPDVTGLATGTPLKKKGGKRGPRGPYKKRKQPTDTAAPSPAISSSAPSPFKKKKIPPADIETARREFEKEREEVMRQVPKKNKKLFNQVGFAKWGKTSLPAMVLDPYSVPPGDIREQWMKMFQNVVEKDRIMKMGHLVWWIGPQSDGQSSYSVVPSHGFIPYEEGEKKNMHELPSKIKRLLDRGSELNKAQMETVESLRLLNELALQPREEREHPRSDFQEEDYWGIDDDEEGEEGFAIKEESNMARKPPPGYEEDDDDEELLDDDEDLMDYSADESSKKSKKKGKKRKKDDIILEEDDDDEDEILYDDRDEEVDNLAPPKKKKKKDKTKLDRGRKKKKKKTLEGDVDNLAGGEEEAKPVVVKSEPAEFREYDKPDMEVHAEIKTTARQSPDAALMEAASAESGDSALADSDYGEGLDETDDPLDPLVGAEAATKKKAKKLKKVGRPKKKDAAIKEEPEDKKIKKKKKKDKAPKEPKKRTKAAEQRDLEKCEEEYLPFVENLNVAREAKDIASIQEVLESLLPVAESFTASFISEYDIPGIMKQTKAVLEETKTDTSTYRKLWNTMKTSYAQKVKELPEGFKPKKRRIAKAPLKESPVRESDEEPSEKAVSVKEEDPKPQAPVSVATEPAADLPRIKTEPDVDVSSPLIKVPIKEGKRRVSAGSDQLSKTVEKASTAKPKPKKFSVMDFMSKKKDNSIRLSSGAGAEKSSSAPSTGVTNKKSVPSWVTAPLPTGFDSFVGCDKREDRMFALEFLLQAAAHFPPNKGVNEESVARNLEMAIYGWSQEQPGNWHEVYWDKVHALVAAITGKRDIGTLVESIMEGEFPSPKALMKLSVENLENSFDGRPIVLNE